MSDSFDISILIVTYNNSSCIHSCLAGLFSQQTTFSYEVLLIDNASKDDTVLRVQSDFPQVKIIANTSNLGFGNANNVALTEAAGQYIVLVNPDAVLKSDVLQRAVEHLHNNPQAGLGGGRLIGSEGEWQPSARRFPSLLNEILILTGMAQRFPKSRFWGRPDYTWADPMQALSVDWVPGAFMIIRRDLLDRIGFFDPTFFLYYEEVDLCYRMIQAGYQVCYWPDLEITHIGGVSSQTQDSMTFASQGKQLTLWRMRSQLLYYRKWHGAGYAWLVMHFEQLWHSIRALKNRQRDTAKVNESHHVIALWKQAWQDTEGGRISPSQPW
jgi:GT2 family glycosyltransferase